MNTTPNKQPKNSITLGVSFMSGLIFGFGLIVSMMIDPAKVLGFLDILGAWDPSLALVMIGAIGVGLPTFMLARRWENQRKHAFNGAAIKLPSNTAISKPLIIGSVLFGVGWGLAGLCPGPALVVAGTGDTSALVFVVAMVVGFYVQRKT